MLLSLTPLAANIASTVALFPGQVTSGLAGRRLVSGAGVMNSSAVVLFAASPQVHWHEALVLGAGAVIGGLPGSAALHRVNERALRIGIALTLGLFAKPI